MIRTSLLTVGLVLASGGYAAADLASDSVSVASSPTPEAAPVYPSQPGPYTVIYREWSDLAG